MFEPESVYEGLSNTFKGWEGHANFFIVCTLTCWALHNGCLLIGLNNTNTPLVMFNTLCVWMPFCVAYWLWFPSLGGGFDIEPLILFSPVAFRALRLSVTTGFRERMPELKNCDHFWRARELRKQFHLNFYPPLSLILYFLPTAFLAYQSSLPVYRIFREPVENPLLMITGCLSAWIFALAEFWTDIQLDYFRIINKDDPEAVMQDGFWGVSRHPNYFCAWMYHVAVWSMAGAKMDASAIAPVAIYAQMRVGLLQPLERHLIEGKGDAYREYTKRVPSPFFPMPYNFANFIWGNGAREWLDEFTAENDRREAEIIARAKGAHTAKQQRALERKEKKKQKKSKKERRKPLGLKQD